jgi:alkylation response protein AidB-like acyl-CoA dehydrogenase
MNYPNNQRQFIAIARSLADTFAQRAATYDRSGAFPYENFADLRAAGLAALIVPVEYGGWGATLLDSVMVIETLARGDGSTALSFTMHVQTLGDAAETGAWPQPLFERVCRAAIERGALINSLATEPELGSPSRGGRPKTTAMPIYSKEGDGKEGATPAAWRIDGRKTWASMSPVLDFMILLTALEDGSGEVGHFLLPCGSGERIVETWDALGMRSTGSHDVFFENVFAPQECLLNRSDAARGAPSINAWFALTVSAVYLGVAEAAVCTAARYALERVPTALGRPIAELENVQRHLGQAQFLTQQAQALLYHAAELWTHQPEQRPLLGDLVSIAKVTATNNAIQAVDHCLRVAGGAGVTKLLPLERYYRDVRAGLNHPPNDDALYVRLGKQALSEAGR